MLFVSVLFILFQFLVNFKSCKDLIIIAVGETYGSMPDMVNNPKRVEFTANISHQIQFHAHSTVQ